MVDRIEGGTEVNEKQDGSLFLSIAVLTALVTYSSVVSVEWFSDTPTESTQPYADRIYTSLS